MHKHRASFVSLVCLVVSLPLVRCGSNVFEFPSEPAAAAFDDGLVVLDATTTRSGAKATTVVIRGDDVVLEMETTVDRIRLKFPLQADAQSEFSFPEPLPDLPGSFASNRLAVFIAGEMLSEYKQENRRNRPGCDFFPDTRCTLSCCAEHDLCYFENDCSISSWWWTASPACKECNSKVASCILRACFFGVEGDPNSDTCFDSACGQSYNCSDGTCTCRGPCCVSITWASRRSGLFTMLGACQGESLDCERSMVEGSHGDSPRTVPLNGVNRSGALANWQAAGLFMLFGGGESAVPASPDSVLQVETTGCVHQGKLDLTIVFRFRGLFRTGGGGLWPCSMSFRDTDIAVTFSGTQTVGNQLFGPVAQFSGLYTIEGSGLGHVVRPKQGAPSSVVECPVEWSVTALGEFTAELLVGVDPMGEWDAR